MRRLISFVLATGLLFAIVLPQDGVERLTGGAASGEVFSARANSPEHGCDTGPSMVPAISVPTWQVRVNRGLIASESQSFIPFPGKAASVSPVHHQQSAPADPRTFPLLI